MGSVVSGILGGGGGEAVQTGQSGFASLPQFAQDAFRDVISRGQTLSNQENLFAPSPFTSQQNQALSQVGALSGPLTQQDFTQRMSVFQNPFEEQVIQNSIRDMMTANRGTLSDIGQGASAAGGFGGTRQALLESEANKNLLQSIGDMSAKTRSQGFDTATNNVLNRLGQESGLAGQLFGLGSSLQQQNTATLQSPLQAVQFLSDLARGVPSTSTQSQLTPNGPGIGSTLGGIGGLVGGLGTFFSDRRLKENIKKVGEKNGHNIYNFNYLGCNNTYRGVMADEVKEIMPDAVTQCEEGYDVVDYGKLGIEFMEVL